MYTDDVHLFGTTLSIWNTMFLIAIAAGYIVFRLSAGKTLSFPALRYFVVAYLSAIAAQVFAYAFDVNTSLTPPPGVSLWSYYLDPLAGPKTLYGVIVLMPVSICMATVGSRQVLARQLDHWTPAMLAVLSVTRVGCLLQGCCYGARSDLFGVSFPAGASVYWLQRHAGQIPEDAQWSLPVIPTQGIEAVFIALLAIWSWRRRNETAALFLPAVVAYSLFRFVIEFARADVGRGLYGPLATSQWIALGVLTVAVIYARVDGGDRDLAQALGGSLLRSAPR